VTTTSTGLRPVIGRRAALLLILLVAVGTTACSPGGMVSAVPDPILVQVATTAGPPGLGLGRGSIVVLQSGKVTYTGLLGLAFSRQMSGDQRNWLEDRLASTDFGSILPASPAPCPGLSYRYTITYEGEAYVIDDCRVPAPVRPTFADLLTVFDMFDPFKTARPR
jgi:hypothetical protein